MWFSGVAVKTSNFLRKLRITILAPLARFLAPPPPRSRPVPWPPAPRASPRPRPRRRSPPPIVSTARTSPPTRRRRRSAARFALRRRRRRRAPAPPRRRAVVFPPAPPTPPPRAPVRRPVQRRAPSSSRASKSTGVRASERPINARAPSTSPARHASARPSRNPAPAPPGPLGPSKGSSGRLNTGPPRVPSSSASFAPFSSSRRKEASSSSRDSPFRSVPRAGPAFVSDRARATYARFAAPASRSPSSDHAVHLACLVMPSSSRGLGDTHGPSVACLYSPYTRSLSALVRRFAMDATAAAASANAASGERASFERREELFPETRVSVSVPWFPSSPNAPDPRSSDCARDTASFWRSFLDSRGD